MGKLYPQFCIADLGYYWALMIKSLKATDLVEADKPTALYGGVCVVVRPVVAKSQGNGDSVKEVPSTQRWQAVYIFPVNWYWLSSVQC